VNKYEIDKMDNPWIVKEVRDLTDATYVLRFSRNGMNFKPGQHLVAGMINSKDSREYSIYSGLKDEYLEILVREVEDGAVSKKLRKLQPGSVLEINGPYGFFMYNTQPPEFKKFLFIASGTGIAPFHSFARSFPKADYKIIHGIRTIDEAYEKEDFKENSYVSCTSRDNKGTFHGRLTDYLKGADLDKDALIYLCGNSNMILDAMEIMEKRGLSQSTMFTEVYF
jgi:ferredoxin--NADP+ reductase/benzoate/toluate 1,2-dioxygenase reductase subunit